MPNPQIVKRSRTSESVRAKSTKKRNRPILRFRFGFIVIIWIFCFLGCFLAYMISRNLHPELAKNNKTESSAEESSMIADEPADTPVLPSATESQADNQPQEATEESSLVTVATKINPVPESEPQSADYLAKSAFFGDVNIYHLLTNGLLEADNVYAGETLNLENYQTEYFDYKGTKLRMLSIMRQASCPVYLMFGTDTLATVSPEESASLFSDMVGKVKAAAPEATIYVLAVPPVTAAAEKLKKPILNSNIDTFNSKILEVANDANVYFVDTNTALKNNNSRLDDSLADEDGIHLNAEGGRQLLNYVLSHVPQN